MARFPFVAAAPGSIDDIRGIVEQAARQWLLPEPELVRLSMTGVFTAGADTVLRVCRPTADPLLALELARVLATEGVRVAAPARDDVVQVGELAVLAFERLHPSGAAVDWFGVGRMIGVVHRLDPAAIPVGYPLPRGLDFPWWQLDALLDELAGSIDVEARSGMLRCLAHHRPALDDARDGPGAVCHGDVHVGNVIQTELGPALLDWDLLCREPVGWDHAALRTWATRWGGEAGAYEAFVAGVEEHLDDDPFTLAAADLRLVAATLMRVRAARSDPAAAPEAEQRLRWWRGDPDAPMWRPV